MMRYFNGGLRGPQAAAFAAVPGRSCRRRVWFPTRCSSELRDYAVLGLTPFASKADVKHAYKRLALRYHPDVIRGENAGEKLEIFREIKSAYESLMQQFEEEEQMRAVEEYDEWEEWMGFEGGIPAPFHSL